MQSTSDASGLASRADPDLLTRLEAAVRRGCRPHLKPRSLGGCDQAPHLVAAADAAPLVRQLCCSMGAACHRVHWEAGAERLQAAVAGLLAPAASCCRRPLAFQAVAERSLAPRRKSSSSSVPHLELVAESFRDVDCQRVAHFDRSASYPKQAAAAGVLPHRHSRDADLWGGLSHLASALCFHLVAAVAVERLLVALAAAEGLLLLLLQSASQPVLQSCQAPRRASAAGERYRPPMAAEAEAPSLVVKTAGSTAERLPPPRTEPTRLR